jgi:hypothetical protein
MDRTSKLLIALIVLTSPFAGLSFAPLPWGALLGLVAGVAIAYGMFRYDLAHRRRHQRIMAELDAMDRAMKRALAERLIADVQANKS